MTLAEGTLVGMEAHKSVFRIFHGEMPHYLLAHRAHALLMQKKKNFSNWLWFS